MKGIQSNGFLPIIAQAIAEMEELHGVTDGPFCRKTDGLFCRP